MPWGQYDYDEVMEQGAQHLLLGAPPDLGPQPNDAAVARAQLHATYALACFALAGELREQATVQ
jgi:hypothetical protein